MLLGLEESEAYWLSFIVEVKILSLQFTSYEF